MGYSGYSRGQGKGRNPDRRHEGDRDDRQGYDPRERSPRSTPTGFRREESGSDRYAQGPSSNAPPLPSNVEIPEKGDKFVGNIFKPRGTAGERIEVRTNHFVIQSLPKERTVYEYQVKMQHPPSSSRQGDSKVSAVARTKALVKGKGWFGPDFVFDHDCALGWSTQELMPIGETREATIDLDGHTNDRPNQVHVSVINCGMLKTADLVKFILSGGSSLVSSLPVTNCLKAINAIYRSDPAARFMSHPKSSAFYERAPGLFIPLPSTNGVLEAMRGIFQAVSVSFGRLTLNVDVSCTAFFTPDKNYLDLAKAFFGMPSVDKLNQVRLEDVKECCDRMIGTYFRVRHLNTDKNTKTMRVQSLSDKNARDTWFKIVDPESKEETPTNVDEYFYNRYKIRLKYWKLPLLVCRHGAFPMELCYTAPGERYKEALQGRETADFIKWATTDARTRERNVMESFRKLAHHILELPKSMGLSVKTSMLTIEGRQLPAPEPKYASDTEPRGARGGSWNLRGKTFIKPEGFHAWGLMYFPKITRPAGDQELQDFCRELCTECQNLGIRGPRGPPSFLRGNPQGNVREQFADLFSRAESAFRRKPDLLLVLKHEDAPPPLYPAIKTVCSLDLGVPVQVMDVNKAVWGRGRKQYLANIAMKISLKLGGCTSIVEENLLKQRRFMMLGGDCSHPSPGQLRQNPPPPSFSALVGSYDGACCTYTAICTAQDPTVELMAYFKPMFKKLLDRYKEKNRCYPDSIIYWRDGVSNNQVEQLLSTEVQSLKDVRDELKRERGVEFTITVVNCVKRHHTRLFPTDQRKDKLGNVLPGTVVENSPINNDIYLVSQSALQGTVRPCHYITILDELKLSANEFQRLIMAGTFSYGRATRSVSLHPAVFYAHQAAARAKMLVQKDNNGGLELKQVHDNLRFTMYWQ